MSSKFSIIPTSALFDPRIEPTHICTLAMLSFYGGTKQQGCWPSYQTIAVDLQTSRRTVIAHVKHLVECGYIIKEHDHRADGSQSSNVYRVNLDTSFGPLGDDSKIHAGGIPISPPSANNFTGTSENNFTEKKNYIKPELDKKNKKSKSVLLTLQDWEVQTGAQLNASMISSWCREKGLFHPVITDLIGEFRLEMMSKDKQYADFAKAFQTYLTKGYLSKTLAYAQELSRKQQDTQIHSRGVNL